MKPLILKLHRKYIVRHRVGLVTWIILVVIFSQLFAASLSSALAEDEAPGQTYLIAQAIANPNSPAGFAMAEEENLIFQDNRFVIALCKADEECLSVKQGERKLPSEKVVVSGSVVVTAYSSTYDQTDSSPFITANGTRVHDGVIACNFLPFGSKVKFPEVFGDKVFVVQDRMALKNSHKIDIWMPTRGDALQFGVQRLAYQVIE